MNDKYSRATIVVAILACIAISAMSIGIYKLFCLQKGDECAVTLQFNNNIKATYLGKVV
jgi:hypothetical protein